MAAGGSVMVTSGRRVALEPGGGVAIPGPYGRSIQLKARAADTAGAYSLLEFSAPPHGAWTVPHIHHDAEEGWYVLEGELTFRIGEDRIVAPAGSFLLAPRGTLHAFGNTGTSVARYLALFSPPGMERYFAALHELIQASGGQPDPEAAEALTRQFHMERVPSAARE